MSPPKLRRSRDVSDLHPIKSKNFLVVGDLAVLKRVCSFEPDEEELALQVSDLSVESSIWAQAQLTPTQHISCEGQPTAGFPAGGLSL
jgi:hypothetical protein